VQVDVTDNPEAHRYEAYVDGRLAGFVAYKITATHVALIHTEIEEAFEGKGVASTLVKRALGTVADSGLALLPVCPYVADYLKRHTDFLDLVPAGERARFDLPEKAGPG